MATLSARVADKGGEATVSVRGETVRRRDWVTVPPSPTAVRVKVVLSPGLTGLVPDAETFPREGAISTLLAFVTCQERFAVWPGRMLGGVSWKRVISGLGGAGGWAVSAAGGGAGGGGRGVFFRQALRPRARRRDRKSVKSWRNLDIQRNCLCRHGGSWMGGGKRRAIRRKGRG